MNDDTFRDWLVDRADTLPLLAGVLGPTSEMAHYADETRFILTTYDAMKAAAATDDAGDIVVYGEPKSRVRGKGRVVNRRRGEPFIVPEDEEYLAKLPMKGSEA